MNDAGVRAILLQVDSPGGETTGCLELSDYIYSLRGAKPIYAVADDFAFSAAYALTSAADKIFVTRMGAVGSVGVVVLHTEDSKFNDEQGFKYTYIFKGDRKVDGNPHEPLSERAEKDIQSEIDRQYDQFVATVARNRKADAEKIIAHAGRRVLGGERRSAAGRRGRNAWRCHERASSTARRAGPEFNGGDCRNIHNQGGNSKYAR